MSGVQLYKNNARALLSRILSILNLDWLQHARSVPGVYECLFLYHLEAQLTISFNRNQIIMPPLQGGIAPQIKIEHILCAISKLSTFLFLKKLSEKLKNGTEILVGQAVLEFLFKTYNIAFWSIIQKLLGLQHNLVDLVTVDYDTTLQYWIPSACAMCRSICFVVTLLYFNWFIYMLEYLV